MPRGGARQNAGRKSGWASGCKFSDTLTIRVPKYLAAEVLDFARKLDEAKSLDLDSESNNAAIISLSPVATSPDRKANSLDNSDSDCIDIQIDEPLLIPLEPFQLGGATAEELAHRLGVTPVTVRRTRDKKRNRPGAFEEWSRRKDPDGASWQYDAERKLYVKLDF